MSYFDDTENFDAELFNRYVEVCNENDVFKNKVKVLETTLKEIKKWLE